MKKIAVLGAGTMGAGIAQIAAQNECECVLFDVSQDQLSRASESLSKILHRLQEKGRIESAGETLARIRCTTDLSSLSGSELVIEAIVERLDIKQELLSKVESVVDEKCLLGTNTSSLSVAAISSALARPEQLVGIHFFNPAPLLPLVEIVRSLRSSDAAVERAYDVVKSWGKTPVVTGDTPGFIVNRVARPFYGEAMRIADEGVASPATIDWAMRELGGFKMGPFELVDLIGLDVNYAVSESVFESFYCDPRFRPSLTQKRMVEAGLLGRKSGHGYYDYSDGAEKEEGNEDRELGQQIFERIIAMLINEACDARLLQVASAEDLELAMTKGVNYPKGLLQWGDELGAERVLATLERLQERYGDDRYRANPFLRDAVAESRSLKD